MKDLPKCKHRTGNEDRFCPVYKKSTGCDYSCSGLVYYGLCPMEFEFPQEEE